MLLLRIVILLIGAHTYIFLSGFVYRYLEHPEKADKPENVGKIVEKYLLNPNNGPKKSSKEDIVQQLQDAFAKDERNRIKGEFSNLWKCYLFSLTSITTVGNSGLYLQTAGSRLFFISTTSIGLVLYTCLLHNIAIGLLTVYKSSIDFLIMTQMKSERGIKYKQFTGLALLLLSYLITFLSLVVAAIGAVLSGYGYLFGLFVVFDSVLTIGNFSVLAFVYPWNEIGFVISVNLILLMGLSFLYTSVYITFHFVTGSNFDEIIEYWWDQKYDDGYAIIEQDEVRPFQTFMDKSKGMKGGYDDEMDDRNPFHEDEDNDDKDVKNPFLYDDNGTGISSKGNFDSLTPDFLQNEVGTIHQDENASNPDSEDIKINNVEK